VTESHTTTVYNFTEKASELHRDLFGSNVREKSISRLEIKLIAKYMIEVFSAGKQEGYNDCKQN
jgi:hypothetical protein